MIETVAIGLFILLFLLAGLCVPPSGLDKFRGKHRRFLKFSNTGFGRTKLTKKAWFNWIRK